MELGAYYILAVICLFLQLNRLRGKPSRLNNWLLQRKSVLLLDKDSKTSTALRLASYLKAASMFYMFLPFVILVVWAVLLAIAYKDSQRPYLAPIVIIVIGCGIPLFLYGLFSIKWNHFSITGMSVFAVTFTLVLVIVYQALVIFGLEHKKDFFPVSSFFLNFNVILLTLIVFVSQADRQAGLNDMLTLAFPTGGVAPDSKRSGDWLKEIDAQTKDPQWLASREDLEDIVTFGKVNTAIMESALGNGIRTRLRKMRPAFKRGIEIGLAVASVLVLVIYSLVTFYGGESSLGIITSVNVTVMDVFCFLLHKTQMVDSPVGIVFLLVANRTLMIFMGEGFWIYGYMLLYILYAVAFLLLISKRLYPLHGEVEAAEAKISNLMRVKGLSPDQVRARSRKILGSPECHLLLMTLLYFALVLIAKHTSFEGAEL